MDLNSKLNKLFNPNRAFMVYLYDKDKRVKEYVVLPKNAKFTLEGNGYIINPDRIFFNGKLPCSAYSRGVAEPINPLHINEISKLSSEDFYNAIESKIVQDIIRGGENKLETMTLIAIVVMGIVILLAIGLMFYYFTDVFKNLAPVVENGVSNGSGWQPWI